jgi:uncharacterized protein involved in outer membrane biogenesis
MDVALLTVIFMLILSVAAALIVISAIVPRGFRNINNYQMKAPKVYKSRSYKRSYGRK